MNRSVWERCGKVSAVALVLWGALLTGVSCGEDGSGDSAPPTLSIVGEVPAESEAGQALSPPLRVEAHRADGQAAAGVALSLRVAEGGGTLVSATVETGADGIAVLPWTLGAAPVRNTLEITGGEAPLAVSVDAVRTEPLAAESFGDVNAFLEGAGVEGSTEDLAFGGGRLVLGVPGGLVALDASGTAEALDLTGDPLVGPLGLDYDDQGRLWVADGAGKALRTVSAEGVVSTVLTDDGRPGEDNRPLAGPNFVVVDGVGGHVYLSDPCLGEVMRIDPETGEADAWLEFDLATEGGPNGLAFDAEGRLAIATENTGLTCGHDFVNLIEEIAGVYRVTLDEAGFGERETLVASGGLFGDGLTYDAEGNLYVIFDTQANLELEESAVFVLRPGETELRRFVSASDRIFANLEFGRDAFGATTLYLAMLVIEPFVAPETRGVMRVEVGIPGLQR